MAAKEGFGALLPGVLVDGTSEILEHEPVPDEQVVAGSPTTGLLTLGELGDCSVGLWEMAPGAMWDVESDEVFVVISGRGRVDFEDVPGEGQSPLPDSIDLGPGSVVRLSAGMRTVWTVTETLRKVWLA